MITCTCDKCNFSSIDSINISSINSFDLLIKHNWDKTYLGQTLLKRFEHKSVGYQAVLVPLLTNIDLGDVLRKTSLLFEACMKPYPSKESNPEFHGPSVWDSNLQLTEEGIKIAETVRPILMKTNETNHSNFENEHYFCFAEVSDC